MPIAGIESALNDIRAGKFVIIVDDEDRENEGDLAIAAEYATPQAINFMAREARGLICVAMTGERLDALCIPLMVPPEANTSAFSTAFTVSVEARCGVTTGISAFDRATTIRALIDPATRPEDLVRPGHVFPLRAAEGGVLTRAGQTEASVDLARLAGCYPAAVICEIMRDDGAMARRPDLERFAVRYGLVIITVADLISYRCQRERDPVVPTLALAQRERVSFLAAPKQAAAELRREPALALPHDQYGPYAPAPPVLPLRPGAHLPDGSAPPGAARVPLATDCDSERANQQEQTMGQTFEGHLVGTGLKFGIVISRFNDAIGRELLHGAQDALIRHGVARGDIDVAWVPGAFELPLAARWMARRGGGSGQRTCYDAIICLGVVIRGATPHFDYVAGQAASGIASAAFEGGVPVTFGLVTTENLEQAFERAGTKAGNRGAEAAMAAIEMANLRRLLEN